MLSDQEREDRELMRWFRSLPGETQRIVTITPRERGKTQVRPQRRLAAGRNVSCWLCRSGPVWFTNESGDKARRAAQVAAARHLQGHLDAQPEPAPTEATSAAVERSGLGWPPVPVRGSEPATGPLRAAERL